METTDDPGRARPTNTESDGSRRMWLIAIAAVPIAAALAHSFMRYVFPHWGVPIWPTYVAATGLFWYIFGLGQSSHQRIILVGGGAMVAALGLLILFQIGTREAWFWLFAWPLPPLAGAAGVFSLGELREDPRSSDYALKAGVRLLVAYAALGGAAFAYRTFVEDVVRAQEPWIISTVLVAGGIGTYVLGRRWLARTDHPAP